VTDTVSTKAPTPPANGFAGAGDVGVPEAVEGDDDEHGEEQDGEDPLQRVDHPVAEHRHAELGRCHDHQRREEADTQEVSQDEDAE
jgi:hypothetical protein